jgi:hypothetical protein
MKDESVSASIQTAVIAVEHAGAIVGDARTVLWSVKFPKSKDSTPCPQGILVEEEKGSGAMSKEKRVEVAIIGAGTAGLSACSEVRKATENFVLIQAGPYGSTCARVGCMPSKVLLQVAHDFHRRHVLGQEGICGGRLSPHPMAIAGPQGSTVVRRRIHAR